MHGGIARRMLQTADWLYWCGQRKEADTMVRRVIRMTVKEDVYEQAQTVPGETKKKKGRR